MGAVTDYANEAAAITRPEPQPSLAQPLTPQHSTHSTRREDTVTAGRLAALQATAIAKTVGAVLTTST
jgi:hypothetical protein